MAVASVVLSGDALMGVSSHLVPRTMMAALPQQVCLGRLRPMAFSPCLDLSYYFDVSRHAMGMTSTDWRTKAAVALARMYLNDRLGDCVIAGKMHALAIWSANDTDGPGVIQATDQEVSQQYRDICGPGDNGCVIDRVLDVFRSRGLKANGQYYKIDAYVACDWTNKQLVWAAIQLFAAGTFGINLPQEWTQQSVWKPTNFPIVGGHDVTPCDVDEQGVYVSSWGRIYLMTWAAVMSRQWVEEYKVMLSPTWYNADRLAPSGFSAETLQVDLAKLARGQVPDPDPLPPVPPPTPVPTTGDVTTLVSIAHKTVTVKAPADWTVGRAAGDNGDPLPPPVPVPPFPIPPTPIPGGLMHQYTFEMADVKNVISSTAPVGVRLNSGFWLAGYASQQIVPGVQATTDGEAELHRMVQMHATGGTAVGVDWAAVLKYVLALVLQLLQNGT